MNIKALLMTVVVLSLVAFAGCDYYGDGDPISISSSFIHDSELTQEEDSESETSSYAEDSENSEITYGTEAQNTSEYETGAETESETVCEYLEFRLDEDGTSYTVCNASSDAEGKIIIPQTYENLPVTSISDYAFNDCLKITDVVIPDSIEEIGEGAFMGCSSLISVSFGDGITNIFEKAFKDCGKITSVDIGSVENWCGICFENSESNPLHSKDAAIYLDGIRISRLVIPEGIEKIENLAFINCGELDGIELPNTLKSVGNQAIPMLDDSKYNEYGGGHYLGNTKNPYAVFIKAVDRELTAIEINPSCKTISREAFLYCSTLTSVTLPKSITSINTYAFENCSSLENITFSGTASEWEKIEKQENWSIRSSLASVFCSDVCVSLDK